MKKIYFLFFAFSSFMSNAQNVIAFENFDNVTPPTLPGNWVANPVNGWETSASNASNSTGASGLNNLEIRNTDPTGNYTITTPSYSTIDRINIKLTWIARHTTNFPIPGSDANLLQYSIDNGATWNNVSYVQNPSNSTWQAVNNGELIELPDNANNQPSLILRWTANIIYDLNGTYRIDDFTLLGDLTTNSTENLKDKNALNIYPNPVNNQLNISLNDLQKTNLLQIFDANGKIVMEQNLGENSSSINVAHLPQGAYFIRLINEKAIYNHKFLKF